MRSPCVECPHLARLISDTGTKEDEMVLREGKGHRCHMAREGPCRGAEILLREECWSEYREEKGKYGE